LSSSDAAAEYRPYHDVLCGVDIVLGTGSMTVRECLHLQRHAIIRLTQTAGEDLRVVVNGVVIASGEVVIMDDNTALRITAIEPPPSAERT
jgi:flagellar motor switch protein FliN/FliY